MLTGGEVSESRGKSEQERVSKNIESQVMELQAKCDEQHKLIQVRVAHALPITNHIIAGPHRDQSPTPDREHGLRATNVCRRFTNYASYCLRSQI